VPAEDGDSTWASRIFSTTLPQLWDAEGGDFDETPSARLGIRGEPGYYAFQGPRMVADVHGWLSGDLEANGWILRSEEGALNSQRRFASREHQEAVLRPVLTLVHAPPYQAWREAHFPGMLIGQFLDPEGDPDGDGISNQIEYAYRQSPLTPDNTPVVTVELTPASGGGEDLRLTFRRDSAATDLDYYLQITDDLGAWMTVAMSLSGATATGENGGVIAGDTVLAASLRQVVVKVPGMGTAVRRFARLMVDRRP
jgi:hypothetical protein